MKKLKQKIGDLVVENDVLREALKPYPLAGRCPTCVIDLSGHLSAADLSGPTGPMIDAPSDSSKEGSLSQPR